MHVQVATKETVCKKCHGPMPGCSGEQVCNPCLCKRSQLIQIFGKWPVPAFEKFPEEAQVAFWDKAKLCKRGNQVEALLVKHIEDSRISENTTRDPLSVYKTQGYDAEAIANIEKNSASKWDDELICYTFKLSVVEEHRVEIRRTVEKELFEWKMQGGLRKRMLTYGSPAEKKKRKKSSSSSSRSGSSSSSSKSDSKKARTAKEAKLAAAAAVKETKQAAAQKVKADKVAAALKLVEAKQAAKGEAKAAAQAAQLARAQQAEAKQATKEKAAEDIPCNMRTHADWR